MKQQLFVVFDLKSKTTASQIIVAKDAYVCKRNLITYVDGIAKTIKQAPQDFAVFQLGEFEDEAPSIKPVEQLEMCFSMTEVIDYAGIAEKENS